MAAETSPTFTVAIVGRPNVGKSTLFNRLVGRRAALIHETAGTTRDRREGSGWLLDLRFRLIDTAGLEESGRATIEARTVEQTLKAVAAADLLLFMIDARAGVTATDRHFADRLRKANKPIVVVANKAESRAAESGIAEAYALGLGAPIPFSAEHGEGLAELFEALRPHIEDLARRAPRSDELRDGARPLALAIVGQPNAGKSTLINRLLGEERVVTGPEPGITRDAIAIDWQWQGRKIRLFDTAGLRRKAKIAAPLEKLAAGDALRALQFAEVVILLVDAATVQDFGQGLEKQDLQIADLVEREGRALIVAVNKWDLVATPIKQRRQIRESLADSLAQLRDVPLVTISALEGTNFDRLMNEVLRVEAAWSKRIATSPLNRWLAAVIEEHPPPLAKGRRIKIRYITQARARPPTFALSVSQPDALPESYARYLANSLRREFGFVGVPLRLNMKRGDNPYAKK